MRRGNSIAFAARSIHQQELVGPSSEQGERNLGIRAL